MFLPLFEATTWGNAAASAASSATSLLRPQTAEVCGGGIFDRDVSGVREDFGTPARTRCQLQIYTPPLAHCTSLKPEAACSGFISVPAHTGGIGGAPHTDLSLAVFVSAFCLCREREQGGSEGAREDEGEMGARQDLRMYEMKFIFGGRRHETPPTEKSQPFCSPLESRRHVFQAGVGDGCSCARCLQIDLSHAAIAAIAADLRRRRHPPACSSQPKVLPSVALSSHLSLF